jgi:2-polyprenyl-6-methoxyphenol hydroxylase-like FAD-dependent oxidoreductase
VHRRQRQQGDLPASDPLPVVYLAPVNTVNIQMAPNFGQGANTAIEHAAALANTLHRLLDSREEPSTQELSDALDNVRRRLFPHINTINWASWVVVRLQGYRGRLLSLAGRYVVPRVGEYMISILAWLLAGSVALEYMPDWM